MESLASSDPGECRVAFERLVHAYWKPVYKYARLRWNMTPEDAEDATQSFLLTALEKNYLGRFDPAKARFRTFLRVCVDRFIMNERKSARAGKRGGGRELVSLDFTNAEGELVRYDPPDPGDMEQLFRQEFLRDLFTRTVSLVRDEAVGTGHVRQWEVFERYDLAPGERRTYAGIAAAMDITVSQVTNDLAAMRRKFRARLLEALREVSGSDTEFRAEARDLLGIEVA